MMKHRHAGDKHGKGGISGNEPERADADRSQERAGGQAHVRPGGEGCERADTIRRTLCCEHGTDGGQQRARDNHGNGPGIDMPQRDGAEAACDDQAARQQQAAGADAVRDRPAEQCQHDVGQALKREQEAGADDSGRRGHVCGEQKRDRGAQHAIGSQRQNEEQHVQIRGNPAARRPHFAGLSNCR